MLITFPRMLQEYTERVFNALDEKRQARFAAIKTRAAMEKHAAQCRRDFKKIYALPKEKCPLNAKVTGVIQEDRYEIRKVIFESRPNYFVTANIYVPNGKGPFPGVVIPCGHALEGKTCPLYQKLSAGLAVRGFAVIIFDPIAQGERIEFEGLGCVHEHILAAKKLLLVGEEFSTYRAWDGVRALDCLLESAPIDKKHIGLVGQSGGGTMTSVIMSVDDRYTMAAPSCFITTYRRNLTNELPSDSEQIPRGVLTMGHEMFDHITAFAPKPVMILSKQNDFFDNRGSHEAYAHLKKVYQMLGCGKDIELVATPGDHSIDEVSQHELFRFFCTHAGLPSVKADIPVVTHTPVQLQVTRTGNVHEEGSRSIGEFAKDLADTFARTRKGFTPAVFRKLLSLPVIPAIRDFRVLRPYRYSERTYSRFAIPTEESVFALLKYRNPAGECAYSLPKKKSARIFLPQEHFETEMMLPEAAPVFAENDDASFFILDVRGIGESMSGTADIGSTYFSPYGADFMYSSFAHMADFSLFGRRVYDVLAVLKFLSANRYREFSLAGYGTGGLIALSAAVFSNAVTRVDAVDMPSSFASIMNARAYRFPLSGILPDILTRFDIPDITTHLSERIPVTAAGEFDPALPGFPT
ncbi:MAG: hypothetical protein AABZ39_08935 [Spirochaetota bacterium]